MFQPKNKTFAFIAVLAVAIIAIGFLFYHVNQKVAVELLSTAIHQPTTVQSSGIEPQTSAARESVSQPDPTLVPTAAAESRSELADNDNQSSVQDSGQQCSELFIQSNKNGGEASMKTIELIRAKGTGIYILPEGINADQIREMHLNGQPIVLDHFKILAKQNGVDVFDSNLFDSTETVTADIEE